VHSDYDLVTIDNPDTSANDRIIPARETVAVLHARGKLVLAYTNIGEAEAYRGYWNHAWRVGNPAFLLGTDPDGFAQNYPVRVTDPTWRAIVFGTPTSLVDRAIAAGFDGVMLDSLLAYGFASVERNVPHAKHEISAFVQAISHYAKGRKPGFLIVPQNAATLVAEPAFLAAIDGLTQEDLWFASSVRAQGDVAADPAETRATLQQLAPVLAAGKPIFSVDYATSARDAATAYKNASAAGLREYVGVRDLDALTPFAPSALGTSAKP